MGVALWPSPQQTVSLEYTFWRTDLEMLLAASRPSSCLSDSARCCLRLRTKSQNQSDCSSCTETEKRTVLQHAATFWGPRIPGRSAHRYPRKDTLFFGNRFCISVSECATHDPWPPASKIPHLDSPVASGARERRAPACLAQRDLCTMLVAQTG